MSVISSTPYVFSNSAGNYNKINLDGLAQLGLLKKQVDVPSSGFTTYKLIRDITIDCTIPEFLGSWWENVPDPYVSEVINNIGYAADGGIIAEEWSTLSESNRKRYGYEHYAMVNFGVTQNNYLHLKAGDIFDSNGHTILVDHDICYNEVTGKYDEPLGEIGLTYNGGYIHPLNYAMSGLFRVEEFYADGNQDPNESNGAWSKNPIEIKNLTYGGTAVSGRKGGFFWNEHFGHLQTPKLTQGYTRLEYRANNGATNENYRNVYIGVNVKMENIILTPRRTYFGVTSTSQFGGVLTPSHPSRYAIWPGKYGNFEVKNLYHKVYDPSYEDVTQIGLFGIGTNMYAPSGNGHWNKCNYENIIVDWQIPADKYDTFQGRLYRYEGAVTGGNIG